MAYDDIATLGIKANIGDLDKAIHKLEELRSSAEKTEAAADRLARQETAASNAAQRLAKDSATATRSLSGMSSGANSLSSSMAGAAKSVLALVAAYKSMTGLSSMARVGFQYNEQLEKAQLGIAAVIAATLDLADAQGRVLEGAEKFSSAQKMSVEMAKALDVASMQSPAGYVDLLSTFQRLLAPATQLGLKWQDTLDVTIKMSNVLASLGLDMDRLGKETESILTGKDISRSEVAMRLGISKEELSSWGKGEQLIANFQKRFEAFKYAGLAVEDTMEAVREYYIDVLANAAGDASMGLWTRMKQSMLEVAEAFYVIDAETQKFRKTDEWQPLSELLDKIGTAFGDTLVSGVQSLVRNVQSLGTAVGDIGVDVVFSRMTTSVKVAAAAFIALKVARRAASAEFTVGQGAEQQRIVGLANYARALDAASSSVRARAQQEVQAAATSLAAAKADLQRFQAAQQGAVALRNRQQSAVALAALEKQEFALKAQLVAAETRYSAAVSASGVIMSRAAGAFALLRSAGGSLLAMFGGPLGLAFTAAAAAVGYLATQESSASKFAIEHADAMQMVSANADTARDAVEAYAKTLAEMTQEQRAFEEARVNRTRREMASGGSAYRTIINDITPLALFDSRASEIREKLRDAAEIFLPSNITGASVQELENARRKIADIAAEYDRTTEAAKALETVDAFIALAKQADTLAGSVAGVTGEVQVLNAAVQAIKGLDKILDQSSFAKFTSGLQGGDKAFAQALQGGTSLSTDAIAKIVKGDLSGVAEADKEKIEGIRANFAAVAAASSSKSAGRASSGGSSSSIDNAADRIRRFREEIDQLTGATSKSASSLSDKLADIEKTGKAAKMSAAEIAALREEYKTAFTTDAMEKFNKELLRLEGNAAALHLIEVEEKVREWRNQFSALGIDAADAEQKIGRFREALDRQQQYEDLQTAVHFLEDIANLGGNYGMAIEQQNRLIEYQANLYREKLPASLHAFIAEWERLQQLEKSRDPMDGMVRGLNKYYSEVSNLGKQMEDMTRSVFSGMEDALTDFVRTGKLDFSSLVDSILADLARIAVRSAITAPLSAGLSRLFGGFGGGGGASAGVGGLFGFVGNIFSSLFSAQGNVLSGGSIHAHSNSVVTKPTVFGYGRHLTAFAKGGVMGEAGPEAIMPLMRDSKGRLGVRASGGDGGGQVPQVSVNIINSSGAQVSQRTKTDNMGNRSIDVMIGDAAAAQAMRPGSSLNRVMRNVSGQEQPVTRR